MKIVFLYLLCLHLLSGTLVDFYSISISSATSVASMLSGRELHSNISTGSAASINSSDSSSSIILINENESSIPVIDAQVSTFEDEISFAIAFDLNRFPRLARDGTCVTKMHTKKHAFIYERILVLFTSIKLGWDDYNATKNQRKIIAIAACRQVAYDREFSNNLASSQISAWNKKIYEIIQSGSLFDQESNPLSSDHFGTVKYSDIIEQQYLTNIREMFRYAQRVNGAQSSFVGLTRTINQKSCIVEESRPSLKMHPLQLYRWFVSNKGK